MTPDYIPDHETSALCIAGRWPVRYYLFLSDDGTFVVRHEKRTFKADPSKNFERKDRLGYFWNIKLMLPENVSSEFASAIVDYNALCPKEIR